MRLLVDWKGKGECGEDFGARTRPMRARAGMEEGTVWEGTARVVGVCGVSVMTLMWCIGRHIRIHPFPAFPSGLEYGTVRYGRVGSGRVERGRLRRRKRAVWAFPNHVHMHTQGS